MIEARVLRLAGLVFGSLFASSVLHELTHVAAALVAGARIRSVSVWGLSVEYEVPARSPTWVDRGINLSPALVGLTVGGLYYALAGWPPVTLAGVLGGICWLRYTLVTSPEDYSLRAAHGEEWAWERLDRSEKQLVRGAAIFVLVLAITLTVPSLSTRADVFVNQILGGLSLIGLGIIWHGMHLREVDTGVRERLA